MKEIEFRTYKISDSCVFWKTNEEFGGLSNMAGGYPLLVNNTKIFTTEALYQACKYPHIPELQKRIIGQNSPMFAKKICKPYEGQERKDWLEIRTTVMHWCLHIKLIQNWGKFSSLLLSTTDKTIVEYSERDNFWGAMPDENANLHGRNVLGRLLMGLREQVKQHPKKEVWKTSVPKVSNLFLFGQPIEPPPSSHGFTNDFSDLW